MQQPLNQDPSYSQEPLLSAQSQRDHDSEEEVYANWRKYHSRFNMEHSVTVGVVGTLLQAPNGPRGGVADVVRDGENGYTLPFEAQGEAYAQVIAKLYRDDQRYRQLAQSSQTTFETYLNWDAWGMAVKNIIDETLAVKNGVQRISWRSSIV